MVLLQVVQQDKIQICLVVGRMPPSLDCRVVVHNLAVVEVHSQAVEEDSVLFEEAGVHSLAEVLGEGDLWSLAVVGRQHKPQLCVVVPLPVSFDVHIYSKYNQHKKTQKPVEPGCQPQHHQGSCCHHLIYTLRSQQQTPAHF